MNGKTRGNVLKVLCISIEQTRVHVWFKRSKKAVKTLKMTSILDAPEHQQPITNYVETVNKMIMRH